MLTYIALIFFDGAKIWKRFDLSKYYRNIFWRELYNVFFYDDKNKTISRVLLFGAGFLDKEFIS